MPNPYVAAIGAVVDLGSQVASKIQQDRDRKAHESNVSPLSGGRTLSVTFSVAGTQNVQHLLGRQPTGWIVVGKTATCDVWNTSSPDSSFLYLESSAAATLTLLVF